MQSARLPKFVPDPFAQRQGSPAITAAYTFTDRSELDKINWAGSQIEDRAYDAVGLLTGVDRPGVDETRAYDALNRVTSIGNTNVGDGTYTYDANSNKLSESWSGAMAAWNFVTTMRAGSGSIFGCGISALRLNHLPKFVPDPFAGDQFDRFTNFIQSGQSKTLGLTRSDIGNISNINLNGTNTARGYSNIHALTSIGSTNQVFDTDGNLTNAQTGIDLAWDEAGMMKESIVGTGDTAGIEGTNTYGYDADRKRVWKKRMLESSTNEHTVYIHAGPNVIAEYPAGTAAASPTQEYVYGQEIDSLVLLVRSTGGGSGNEKLTITRNQQWSVTALSDATSGNILERYTYDHFGKRTILEPNGSTVRNTSSYNMRFGYTSRQHDAETGLLFMRDRYYDSLTGEFISTDPLESVDGMSLFRGYFVPRGFDPYGLFFRQEPDDGLIGLGQPDVAVAVGTGVAGGLASSSFCRTVIVRAPMAAGAGGGGYLIGRCCYKYGGPIPFVITNERIVEVICDWYFVDSHPAPDPVPDPREDPEQDCPKDPPGDPPRESCKSRGLTPCDDDSFDCGSPAEACRLCNNRSTTLGRSRDVDLDGDIIESSGLQTGTIKHHSCKWKGKPVDSVFCGQCCIDDQGKPEMVDRCKCAAKRN